MKNKIQIPKTIVIASHNHGKVKEINILLNDINVTAIPISVFSKEEPIEDGNSFAQNALMRDEYLPTPSAVYRMNDRT